MKNKFLLGLQKYNVFEFDEDEIIKLKVFYNHNLYVNEQYKRGKKRIKLYFIIKENNKYIRRVESVGINGDETKEEKDIISNKLIDSIKNKYGENLIIDNLELTSSELNKLTDKELDIFRYITKVINFDDLLLPIDPYYLGLWLGDGTSRVYGEITIGRQDQNVLLPYLRDLAEKLNLTIKEKKCHKDYPERFNMSNGNKGNNILNNTFKLLNLINNKHIPKIYLESSIEDRKALLAGIIDSDGATGTTYGRIDNGIKNYCWDLTLKLENLIDNVETLCKSLGMFTYRTEVKKRAVKKDGNHSEYKTYYRIKITPYNNYDIPLKIERKKICDDILDRNFLPFIKTLKN